ncbi:MAG: copper-binding protein [Betaproteobacteria bacterium]
MPRKSSGVQEAEVGMTSVRVILAAMFAAASFGASADEAAVRRMVEEKLRGGAVPLDVVLALAVVVFAWMSKPPPAAEQRSGEHAAHGGDPGALTDGVVVAVDRSAGQVTISHGSLGNLGMGPMTMGFQVVDRALLERRQPGDKVRFTADVVVGKFTVIRMERAN